MCYSKTRSQRDSKYNNFAKSRNLSVAKYAHIESIIQTFWKSGEDPGDKVEKIERNTQNALVSLSHFSDVPSGSSLPVVALLMFLQGYATW